MSDKASMRKRLLADVAALEDLSAEIEDVEAAQAKAQVAFDEAKAALARADTQVANVHLREKLLKRSVRMLSRSLSTLSTFPFELLSMIFAYANTESERNSKAGGEDYAPPIGLDMDRVLLPWSLGAVCRHWRAAVDSTPEAWSFIGISHCKRSASPQANADCIWRLSQSLEKSGAALLDVVFTSSHLWAEDDSKDFATLEHSLVINTFDLLTENMARIRTLGISLAPFVPRSRSEPLSSFWLEIRGAIVELLRTPSPALVDARIQIVDRPRAVEAEPAEEYWHQFPDDPLPLFLPAAPKLRYLLLDQIPVAFRRPHVGLPSLERIRITQYWMFTVHVADMLALAPKLQHLELDVRDALSVTGITPNFEPCHNLHTLVTTRKQRQTFGLLAGGARFLPKLSSLSISNVAELDISESFARRLTTLRLSHTSNLHEHLETLRQLTCIERAGLSYVTVQDDVFFDAFCEPVDPMWPKLKTLMLRVVNALTVEQDGILRLVRARNGKDDGAAALSSSVSPLEDLDFDSYSVPSWVAVQVREILPERHDDDGDV
ncbi:hypothetical protein AURDEDRAFT_162138 [Auricularia subglabra TFB-10046 SS5]|nr:hypothetical protein AURDEDRAFT_162138 [Auricularia subglabra TFB-10046 SS5]